jgi:hypothetical protein
MLPILDSLNPGAGGVIPPRPEHDRVADAYRTSERKTEVRVREDDQYQSRSRSTDVLPAKPDGRDQVELNFHLTLEERDAFQAAFGSKQNPDVMSPEEKETLQKAAERISSYIDEAIARNSDNRERVEKAVGEWYSRLTKGESKPMDLINLLRQAAMRTLDDPA